MCLGTHFQVTDESRDGGEKSMTEHSTSLPIGNITTGGTLIEYAETYIGDCTDGDCDRVATVRVHDEWVLCSLHHEIYLLAREADDADLTLDFIKKWRSQAQAHDLGFIQLCFDRAVDDLADRKEIIRERRDALNRIEAESVANHDLRIEMGERLKRDALTYPTAFARILSELAHYLGEDWRKFAGKMVSTAGDKYGAVAWDWLYSELMDTSGRVQPDGFMADLAAGLGLDARQRTKLAMAYTYGREGGGS